MIYDSNHKESARDKATRKWRNNAILRKIQQQQDQEPISPSIRKQILSIFHNQIKESNETNESIMAKYMLAIEWRRRRLLKEKLRRLMENNNE